jgi:hypothetical protein
MMNVGKDGREVGRKGLSNF